MNHVVHFTGHEGDRSSLFDIVIQTTACPRCGARVNEKCVSKSEAVGICELNHPHVARVQRARKLLLRCEPGEPYPTPYPPEDERNTVPTVFQDPEPSDVGLFQIRTPQEVYTTVDPVANQRIIEHLQEERKEREVHGTQTGRLQSMHHGYDKGGFEVSKKQVLEGQLGRLLTELDKLEAIGEDVYENDTVLSIKYKHSNSDKEYDYVALKSDDRWYVTGYQNQGPRTWDKMMEYFSHGEIVGIWMATGWEQVV
jgi:hypothetical protein